MKNLFTLISALALCLPLFGQAAKKAGAEVEFRVTRVDPADGLSPEFQVGPPEKQIAVKIPLTYIEGPFKTRLRNDRFLDFWKKDGEKPEISIEISEAERKDLLLFFLPTKDSFKVMKLHTPIAKIGGGDRFLFNATDRAMAIKLGDGKPIIIESGKSGIVRGAGGKKVVSLPVLISQKDGDEWTLVSTEQWVCDPRVRRFLFVYMSPRTHHLVFHGVSESLASREASSAQP